MFVVLRVVIDDAGDTRMHVGAPQFFGADHFTGCRLDQRRATQKDGALLAHDDRLIAHRRHVGAAGSAGPHHHRDLRNSSGRHVGLVVKNSPEVIAIRKHILLARQMRSAGIDQVNTGQIILRRDVLRAQVFLHRDRIVGAALDGGVVGDNHAFQTLHSADAGNQSARRNIVIAIHLVTRKLANLEKRCTRIDQALDPLTRQQLVTTEVLCARALATTLGDDRDLCVQIIDQRAASHRDSAGTRHYDC